MRSSILFGSEEIGEVQLVGGSDLHADGRTGQRQRAARAETLAHQEALAVVVAESPGSSSLRGEYRLEAGRRRCAASGWRSSGFQRSSLRRPGAQAPWRLLEGGRREPPPGGRTATSTLKCPQCPCSAERWSTCRSSATPQIIRTASLYSLDGWSGEHRRWAENQPRNRSGDNLYETMHHLLT